MGLKMKISRRTLTWYSCFFLFEVFETSKKSFLSLISMEELCILSFALSQPISKAMWMLITDVSLKCEVLVNLLFP